MENSNTLEILKQLERGEISAADAQARLDTVPEIERAYEPGFEETGATHWVEDPATLSGTQRLWIYPLVAGLLLVGLGTWIIIATVHANILWLLLGLPIVLLGSLVLAVAASARSGHWMYVNIKQAGRRGHNIRFGLPVPFGLIRFGLWIARWFVWNPEAKFRMNRHAANLNFDLSDADDFIAALERELAEKHGVTVNVDDNDEQVQVYIV